MSAPGRPTEATIGISGFDEIAVGTAKHVRCAIKIVSFVIGWGFDRHEANAVLRIAGGLLDAHVSGNHKPVRLKSQEGTAHV